MLAGEQRKQTPHTLLIGRGMSYGSSADTCLDALIIAAHGEIFCYWDSNLRVNKCLYTALPTRMFTATPFIIMRFESTILNSRDSVVHT